MRLKLPKGKDWTLIARAMCYFKPYKIKFFATFLCILSMIGFGVVEPLLWGKILVNLFNRDINSALMNITLIVGLNILKTLIDFTQSYLFSYLSEHIIFNLKNDMYNKILDLPVEAFDEIKTGEFISRLNGDAALIAYVLTNQVLKSAVDILRVVIIGITVFSISLPLALIVVAGFPFSTFIFRKSGVILRKKSSEIAKLNDKYYSNTNESILGIREIKCLGIKKDSSEAFKLRISRIMQKAINISVTKGLAQVLSQSVNLLLKLAVMTTGGFLVVSGALKMESFVAFSSYSNQFSDSLLNLTSLNSEIQQAMTALERIFHLMDNLSFRKESFGKARVKTINGNICFDKVSFGYEPNSYVLDNISFKIAAGSKTAIVGSSGSGKTTLFSLLLRLYKLEKGKIYIDGIDIEKLCEDSLRSHISVVRQEPFLFNASILDNLLLAKPDATQKDLDEACNAACIYNFIMELPQKFDTVIGENGITLSGGQKQRIAIARALIKKSKIILFDEATSSLDNESQHFIKKAIDRISKEHTVVIIAHRLSTIAEVDNIIVLENGEIAGQGSHSTLIRNNLVYKRLYESELSISDKDNKEVICYKQG